MQIKVNQRGATVRGRSWVMLPRPGEAPLRSMAASLSDPAAALPATPARPVPLPDSVRPLADVYARQDYAAFEQALQASTDLANTIRDFRAADMPWPEAPRRAPVFGLELAMAGLYSDNGFARDEAMKLLAQMHAVVQRPAQADAFECSWYWAEAAALTGLRQPEFGAYFVDRARGRCPDHPRLRLASALMLEQLYRRDGDAERAREAHALYEQARQDPDTALEASVRAAWLSQQTGALDRAVELLGPTPPATADPQIRYLHGFVRGQILRARGDADGAAAAYREALDAWPGAQSANVALMTLLVGRGEPGEAARLAESVQGADRSQLDPWWLYSLGDFRGYTAIIRGLRELAQ
jgi:tetratricopeptide (TPR) repeat protein